MSPSQPTMTSTTIGMYFVFLKSVEKLMFVLPLCLVDDIIRYMYEIRLYVYEILIYVYKIILYVYEIRVNVYEMILKCVWKQNLYVYKSDCMIVVWNQNLLKRWYKIRNCWKLVWNQNLLECWYEIRICWNVVQYWYEITIYWYEIKIYVIHVGKNMMKLNLCLVYVVHVC